MWKKINSFFSAVEWRLSLGSLIGGVIFPATTFVLPAWATKVSGVFSQYAPLSWVIAGFVGLFAYALGVAIYGYGQAKSVRSRYDAKFMQQTGGVDPMSKVFEQKRIYLTDFVLPSNPFVEGKTFVDCEIVGPSNMFFERGNGADNIRHGNVDAVALAPGATFSNGITFRGCTFRGCTFHRVTIFFSPDEASRLENLDWIKWISLVPRIVHASGPLKVIEDQTAQSPPSTAT